MNVSTRLRAASALLVCVLVVTAGCAGGLGNSQEAGGDAGGQQSGLQADGPPEEAAGEGDGGGGDGEPLQVRQRAVIRTGHVDVRVEEFDAARRNITRTVRGYGGFVSDSRVEVNSVGNESYETGLVVLRVPRENFSAMMADATALGAVRSSSTESEDVTDKLVDIEARLENLRAERDRLRQLYQNANDTEDVLAVEERLSEVQGEIERLEARQQELERKVAFSTIRVELREPRPDRRVAPDHWYDTPVLSAFLQSVDGVVVTLRALVVAGAYALPYLVVFGVPVVGAVAVLRRRWSRPSLGLRSNDGGDGSVTTPDFGTAEPPGSEPDDTADAKEGTGESVDATERTDESVDSGDGSEE
jgi:hypothetical protein